MVNTNIINFRLIRDVSLPLTFGVVVTWRNLTTQPGVQFPECQFRSHIGFTFLNDCKKLNINTLNIVEICPKYENDEFA
jgi:hypothetical protein